MKTGRWYYGWTIVVALGVTITVSYGSLWYSTGAFIGPMRRDTGWSTGEISGAFAASSLVGGLLGMPVGWLTDRYGARWVMSAGSAFGAAGLLLFSFADSLVTVYVAWAVLIGAGAAGSLYPPAFTAITSWFDEKRGSALGLLTFLGGFAAVIFIPLTALLAEELGWRVTARILALVLVTVPLPLHALVLRRRPEDLGLARDGRAQGEMAPRSDPAGHSRGSVWRAVRRADFAIVTAAVAASSFATATVIVHQLPHLTEQGLDPGTAGSALGLIGVASLPARWVLSSLASRISPAVILACVTAAMGGSLFILAGASNMGAVYAYVLLFGVGFGTLQPLRAEVMARSFEREIYGSVLGVQGVALAIVGAAGPLAAGLARDATGGYDGVIVALAAFYFGSSALMLYAARASGRRPPAYDRVSAA